MITILKTNTLALPDINKNLKTLAFYTWVAAGIFFSCYLYFVGAITFSVIKERGLQQETRTLMSQMGQEELKYLNAQKNLTHAYALSSGFVPASTVSFATSQKSFALNVGR